MLKKKVIWKQEYLTCKYILGAKQCISSDKIINSKKKIYLHLFFTYSNKELTFDNSLWYFLFLPSEILIVDNNGNQMVCATKPKEKAFLLDIN